MHLYCNLLTACREPIRERERSQSRLTRRGLTSSSRSSCRSASKCVSFLCLAALPPRLHQGRQFSQTGKKDFLCRDSLLRSSRRRRRRRRRRRQRRGRSSRRASKRTPRTESQQPSCPPPPPSSAAHQRRRQQRKKGERRKKKVGSCRWERQSSFRSCWRCVMRLKCAVSFLSSLADDLLLLLVAQ